MAHDTASSRMKAMLAVLDKIRPSEFPQLARSLEESGLADLRGSEYNLLFATWAEDAPEDAMDYASQLFESNVAKNVILESWSSHNPEAALRWAQENYASPNADLANPWLLGVVRGAAANNVEFAISVVESMPSDSKGRTEALGVVLNHWYGKSADEALQWVHNIQEEELRFVAYNLLAQRMIQSDPEAAFEKVSALNSGAPLEAVAEEMAHYRYLENPDDTKGWITTLPVSAIGEAASAVVSHSTKEDPIKTAQWMAQLLESNPDGYYQDAIRTLITDSTLIEPQIAAEWVIALDSEREQGRYYQEVLSEWLEKDSQAVNDWVQYNYQDMPEHVLLRFFPGFVPQVNPHNRDEAEINPNAP